MGRLYIRNHFQTQRDLERLYSCFDAWLESKTHTSGLTIMVGKGCQTLGLYQIIILKLGDICGMMTRQIGATVLNK